MSLQDILAKKRAAAATPAPSPAPAPTAPPPTVPEPPAPAAESKPLTFAEKIALKRKQDAEAAVSKPTAAPVVEANPLAILEESTNVAIKKEPKEVPIVTDNMEVQQVYANLLEKINDLEHLTGDDLKNAMTNLKKGLMENPDACELMLDEDIGEMVKALRRITMQAVIETKETGSGRKKPKASTMAAITPEQLAQGLADL